ncbi:MAG: prolyl oligopeptidase family serine peptidase [Pseudomonadota bacterium]
MALLATAAVAETGAEPIAIDDLFKRPADFGHKLSPNGDFLAYKRVAAGRVYIAITDLDTMNDDMTVDFGNNNPRSISWLNNNTMLLDVNGELYSLDRRSANVELLLEYLDVKDGRLSSIGELKRSANSWRLLNTLPDDNQTIIVHGANGRGFSSVYAFDMLSKERKALANGKKIKAERWIADRLGTPQLAQRSKKDQVLFFVRAPSGKWVEHGKLHDNPALRLSYDARSYLDRKVIPVQYGYDGRSLYVMERAQTDKFRLVRYDPIADQVLEVVYEDPTYDLGSPSRLPRLHFDDSTQTLVGISYLRDKNVTHWFEDDWAVLQRRIDKALPDTRNLIDQASADRSRILVRTYSDDDWGATYIYKPEAATIEMHTSLSPQLDETDLPERRTVRYEASDGVSIEAYLTLPEGDGPKPLIVMPHGGPFVRSSGELDLDAAFFATRGYAVLDPNFRGSTGFGKAHLSGGFDEFGGRMIDDIADGARWAIRSGYADPERVYILGWSYGGYAALMSGARYPELYRAIVAGAAPSDLARQVTAYKKSDDYFGFEYWKAVLGDPKKEREALRQISPLYRLDDIRAPMLVFHGNADNIVPLEQAEYLEEAFREEDRDDRVIVLQGEGHGFTSLENKAYFLEKSLEHFGGAIEQGDAP